MTTRHALLLSIVRMLLSSLLLGWHLCPVSFFHFSLNPIHENLSPPPFPATCFDVIADVAGCLWHANAGTSGGGRWCRLRLSPGDGTAGHVDKGKSLTAKGGNFWNAWHIFRMNQCASLLCHDIHLCFNFCFCICSHLNLFQMVCFKYFKKVDCKSRDWHNFVF